MFIVRIKIKQVREEKKMSLRKMEEETGIEREYLADIENGKILADEILFIEMLMIAEALDCNITDLYETQTLEIL